MNAKSAWELLLFRPLIRPPVVKSAEQFQMFRWAPRSNPRAHREPGAALRVADGLERA
jgi:hypothetical protein